MDSLSKKPVVRSFDVSCDVTMNKLLNKHLRGRWINSLSASVTYMHQYTRPSLVQIMACPLFSAKALYKPMMGYCQLDPKEQTSVKF